MTTPQQERTRRTHATAVVEADTEPFDTQSMLPDNGPGQTPEDPFAGEPAGAQEAAGQAAQQPDGSAAGGHEDTGYIAIDIMAADPEILSETILQNLGDSGLNINDLRKVTVPPAGATAWNIETGEGQGSVKFIEGIIIHKATPRAWWEKSLDQGGRTQPDCSSPDGVYGTPGPAGSHQVQTPSGATVAECSGCPLNAFGSGRNGRGKACQEKELLYLLQKDRLLPIIVQVPATSLGNLHDYMVRLVDSKDFRPYWQVETQLGLETVKSDTGMSYSKVVLSRGASVPKSQVPQLKQFRERLVPALTRFGDQFHRELMAGQNALPEPNSAPPETGTDETQE